MDDGPAAGKLPFTQHAARVRSVRASALLVLSLTIQACGGGGSDGSNPPPPEDPVNRAPSLASIVDLSIEEGINASVEVSAVDPDGDAMSLELPQLPNFITVDEVETGEWTLLVEPDFDASGEYAITINVIDSDGAADSLSFLLTVVDVNRAPELAALEDMATMEGLAQNIAISANDPDGDPLSFSGTELPGFVELTDNGDGTAALELQPHYFSSGDYVIEIVVADSRGLADRESFNLSIADVNRAPLLTPVTNISIAEGDLQQWPLAATDPDGDSVAFSAIGLPDFVSAADDGDGTGQLVLTPGFLDSGVYAAVIRIMDPGGLIDESPFTISVTDVNRAPIPATLTDQSLAENDTVVIPLSATDPDEDAITFSGIALPSFASVLDNGNGTAELQIAPGYFDSGNYTITIRVTDSAAASADVSMSLTVENTNRAPALDPITDRALTEEETLDILLNAFDPDDDNLVLSAEGLPDFISLQDNGDGSGDLSVRPDYSSAGIYPVTIRVTDEFTDIDEVSFFVTVGDVNRPPVLASIADPVVPEGSQNTVLFDASDPDGDNVSFEADNLPAFITLEDYGDGSGALNVAPQLFDSGTYSVIIRASDSGFPELTDELTVQVTVNLSGANHVARENSLPGTTDWQLDDPALLREIEGYASATSVNRGEIISLFVNTAAPTFTLEVFRTGWYAGTGARRVLDPIVLPGTVQITPAPDPTTGLVEANWVNGFELQTSDSIAGDPWPTGVYLARLTESVQGKQSYIIFVVREDGYRHDVLFQLPVTTYQAYNAWGGKSLYDFNSGNVEPWGSTDGTRASHISFDRPYARNPDDSAGYGMGAGEYLANVQPIGRIDGAGWDYNMVRWLEYEQYDVAYITNIDTHRSPLSLRDAEVLVSQGHDEYWSWEMRTNVEAARDAGTDLAFFSSNAAYAQIRFESSPSTGDANRVIVAYKDELQDPVFNDANPLNDYLTTIPFRYLPVPWPEEELIGVQYVLDPYDGDIIVTNPTHWVFDKTGFVDGSRLFGLLGYEPDGIFGDGPANLEVLAETPIVSDVDPTNTGTSHMTIYDAGSAEVFATGSLQWSWGLDDFNAPQLRTSRLSAAAQQITGNVLERFGALPYPDETVVSAAYIRIVSLADAAADETMAAAEFDLLDANGVALDKSGWLVNFVDSEETVGFDGAAINAIDDDPTTFWQTDWFGPDHPHEIQIDTGGTFDIAALRYTPRQDSSLDGTVTDFEIYSSPDCASWSLLSAATWEDNSGRKIARFSQ